MLKKAFIPLLLALCMLTPSFAEEEFLPVVEFELSGGDAFGGMLMVSYLDGSTTETGSYGFGCEVADGAALTVGDILLSMDVTGVEPMLEGDIFEGWMIHQLVITEDEDGFSEWSYTRMDDALYTTEELFALPAPDYYAVYTAKWASVPAEDYYSMTAEEEVIVLPSISMFSGEGVMLMHGEDEDYECTMRIVTVEEGQTFGEALMLEELLSVTLEGKELIGWTVYDVYAMASTDGTVYDMYAMDSADAPAAEDGTLCIKLSDEWYVVLQDYSVCAELVSTQELSGMVCDVFDHVIIAYYQ